MKITIECTPKEIADLAPVLQNQPFHVNLEEINAELDEDFIASAVTRANNGILQSKQGK